MTQYTLEIGKLMAQVDTLQKQLTDIKKEVCSTKKQIVDVHTELINFMGTVQLKGNCRILYDKIGKDFISRQELAPIRNILNIMAATAVTAICVALMNLILK
ncbi:MAG: hypothetical protein IKV03_04150 [Alphaproteobacteria bacterium]|nr:hypothetical protein [Alphaproteobacteria bacterium]